MPLFLHSFRKDLPEALIQKAEKLKVRDLDTLPSGTKVAFAEEGKNDFDVSLDINAQGEIVASSCDCQSPQPFCHHKVALLLFLEKKKSGPKAGGKSKSPKRELTPAEMKMSELPEEELRMWLQKLFKKRKDLELEFLQAFSPVKTQFTYDEVRALSEEVIQSVVKSKTKKKMEMSEIRKILGFWKTAHAPVLEYYSANPAAEDHYRALEGLLISVIAFDWRIRNNTNKLQQYEIEVLEKAGTRISQIMDFSEWQKALLYFVRYVESNPGSVLRHLYLNFLWGLYNRETGERQRFLRSTGLFAKVI